ncbi:hypothetical protein LGH82_17560 [Mesorhizobium sp. PAMC28654]|uniref:hypothetical protein n=1 Tax=Mesorhizobium sp. PAMC28654 TaxID=2880934 RepID=UPI001D0A2376|nr:hypothetical protein [Mesorhizobium sp. PAMC28654]UDL87026.1 hypothetical protein LGH82_17560 [Mesorhizobium sp. PAMC28654]
MNARPMPSDFLPLTAARRRRIERAVEVLLAILDEADGDPDLEPGADREGDLSEDEPSLGWTLATNQTLALKGGADPFFIDGEFDGGDIPEGDDEREQPDHVES